MGRGAARCCQRWAAGLVWDWPPFGLDDQANSIRPARAEAELRADEVFFGEGCAVVEVEEHVAAQALRMQGGTEFLRKIVEGGAGDEAERPDVGEGFVRRVLETEGCTGVGELLLKRCKESGEGSGKRLPDGVRTVGMGSSVGA